MLCSRTLSVLITHSLNSGNNAIAFKGSQSNVTTESSTGLNFIFTQNPAAAPTTAVNINAARTNAFYIVNSIHDITYIYGFTEVREDDFLVSTAVLIVSVFSPALRIRPHLISKIITLGKVGRGMIV